MCYTQCKDSPYRTVIINRIVNALMAKEREREKMSFTTHANLSDDQKLNYLLSFFHSLADWSGGLFSVLHFTSIIRF